MIMILNFFQTDKTVATNYDFRVKVKIMVGDYGFKKKLNNCTNHGFNFKPKIIVINFGFNFLKKFKTVVTN